MLRAARDLERTPDWTFYCTLGRPGRLDEEARRLGATIVYSPVPLSQTRRFLLALRRTLRSSRFDVLHCHHDVLSAVYLLSSLGVPIRQRIVHVHNADLGLPTANRLKATLLQWPMRQLAILLSDRVVGISNHTLSGFLASHRRRQGDTVLYYGIDLTPLRAPQPDRAATMRSLRLPPDARVLLYAGRLVGFKNPAFAVHVLARIARDRADVFAVFAGTGPLDTSIVNQAERLGVGDRVRLLGWRDDVRQLMQVFDVLVFPRLEARVDGAGIEGLGLVVVEAQAAGLPVVTSFGVPEDAIVVPELCTRLRLSDGVQRWADVVAAVLQRPRMSSELVLAHVENSPFEPHRAFDRLDNLHRT